MSDPEAAPAGPYKAYQSYGPADGDLFFGRETEGVMLARWFQDHPFAVLTAPSGIGKTSLVNARVIPLLEQQHWSAIYCRPNDDPLASLGTALCEHMFPNPADEALVASRLLAAIGDEKIDLQRAIDWFKVLPLHKRVESRLFVPAARDFAALPVISRALRGSLSCGDVIEHFEALVAEGMPLGLTGQTLLTDVVHLLARDETVHLRQRWVNRVGEARRLGAMLQLLDDQWLSLKPGTAGVFLVVDQFEEVFTRLPPSTIERFMAEVGEIFAWRSSGATQPHSKPMNVAVSLRKEFFADLVPRLRKLGVRDVTYFLEPMTREAARLAVSRPTALFGMEFSPPTVDRILAYALDDGAVSRDAAQLLVENELPDEPRYAPALISLIGAYLWKVLPPATDGLPKTAITPEQLPPLESVFEAYLKEAMAKITLSKASPIAALELLDRLVTGSGFRNIVPQEELVRRWPFNKAEFRKLLDLLDSEVKLIRREPRHGGLMVEIMHERLIQPARAAFRELRRREPIRAILPLAYDMLAIAPDDPFVTANPMPADFRDALLSFLKDCDLDPLKAKTLLRSVIAADREGVPSDQDQARWASAVRQLATTMLDTVEKGSEAQRNALPVGDQLDRELDALGREREFDEGRFRRVAFAALADVTDQAGPRVSRAFAYLDMIGGRR